MIAKKTNRGESFLKTDIDKVQTPGEMAGPYPLTATETAIINYFNAELLKIDIKLNEMRRILEQIRDEARQRAK